MLLCLIECVNIMILKIIASMVTVGNKRVFYHAKLIM